MPPREKLKDRFCGRGSLILSAVWITSYLGRVTVSFLLPSLPAPAISLSSPDFFFFFFDFFPFSLLIIPLGVQHISPLITLFDPLLYTYKHGSQGHCRWRWMYAFPRFPSPVPANQTNSKSENKNEARKQN